MNSPLDIVIGFVEIFFFNSYFSNFKESIPSQLLIVSAPFDDLLKMETCVCFLS